jgi:hypothetical protein
MTEAAMVNGEASAGAPQMQLPAELIEYAEAQNRSDKLKAELQAIDARCKELDPLVLDWFQRAGAQSVNLAGRTIYIRRELWAGKTAEAGNMTADEIQECFARAGLEGFCEPRINTQSLSAWVREQFAQAKGFAKAARSNSMEIDPESVLPAALRGVVKVTEQFKLGVRKSTKR